MSAALIDWFVAGADPRRRLRAEPARLELGEHLLQAAVLQHPAHDRDEPGQHAAEAARSGPARAAQLLEHVVDPAAAGRPPASPPIRSPSPPTPPSYENATDVIPISSGGRLRQKRPPSSETKSRDSRGVQHGVGIVLVDRDRDSRGEPAAGLAPRQPGIVREQQRRPPVDDGDDPRAHTCGRDDERQRHLDVLRDRRVVVRQLRFLALEVDPEAAERRRDESLHQRAMIVETNRLAR